MGMRLGWVSVGMRLEWVGMGISSLGPRPSLHSQKKTEVNIFLHVCTCTHGTHAYTQPQECSRLHEETGRLRRDNSSLDAGSHEQEKSIGQLRTRVAVLEQELADKEQVGVWQCCH